MKAMALDRSIQPIDPKCPFRGHKTPAVLDMLIVSKVVSIAGHGKNAQKPYGARLFAASKNRNII